MKNELKLKIFLFFIILLPSIFNSESFLFIRFYSIFIIISIFYFYRNLFNINKISLLISIIYIGIIVYFYLYSPNKHNIRIHFAEYIAYLFLLLFFSTNNYMYKLEIIAQAIVLSGIVQTIYSINQIIKHVNRIHGNTNYANFLSFFFILSFISALYLIKINRDNIKKMVVFSFIGIIFLLFMFLTGSRNIFILLPTLVFIGVFFYRKKTAIIFTVIIFLLLLLIPSKSKNRILNEGKINPYGVQRLNIYKQVIKITKDNLPMGVGFNNLEYYTLKNNFPVKGTISRYGSHAKIAHNEYLEWMVNTGLWGVLLIVIVFFIFIKLLFYRKKNDDIIYLILILSMFLIFSLIDNSLYLPINSIVFFIFLSISIYIIFNDMIKINKFILLFFSIIVMMLLLSDIVGYYSLNKVVKSVKQSYEKKDSIDVFRNYSKDIFYISLLGDGIYCYNTKYQIDKYIYISTKRVDDFMEMYYDLQYMIKYDKMNYKNYLKNAEFYLNYKTSIFRRYKNIDYVIKFNFLKAIDLNPHNPFIKYDYSLYLLSIGDTINALEQLYKSIKEEPYYLEAYSLISKLDNNDVITSQFKDYMDNYEILKKKAKTNYEKRLIHIK